MSLFVVVVGKKASVSEPIQSENMNDMYAFLIRNPTGTQLSFLSVKENSEVAHISMPSISGRQGGR